MSLAYSKLIRAAQTGFFSLSHPAAAHAAQRQGLGIHADDTCHGPPLRQ
jgi:hypothetical protein